MVVILCSDLLAIRPRSKDLKHLITIPVYLAYRASVDLNLVGVFNPLSQILFNSLFT